MTKFSEAITLLKEIKADEGTPPYIRQFIDDAITSLEQTHDERRLQNLVTILDASSNVRYSMLL